MWRFFLIYKKLLFCFYPTDLVNTKTTIPLKGRWTALDIYLGALRLGMGNTIHLPLGG